MSTPIIDVHAHCVPRGLLDRIVGGELAGIAAQDTEGGPRWTFEGASTTAPIEPLLVDVDARIAAMDATGVEVQLLSGFIDVGAHHLGEAGPAYARIFNDELAATIAPHPGRFRGLGTLPLNDVEGSVAELRRQVLELGFVGVEVPAALVPDPGLEPVWAEAARLGALVLVHPEASTTATLPYFIGNFVANPAESTAAAAALILSGVLERHPALTVVLVHGGGFLPYQLGRLAHGFGEYGDRFGARATVPPREQVRALYFDTVVHDPAALRFLVDTVGHDRVVVGTDYPFAMGDADPAATVDTLTHLDDRQRDAIRRDTVARLLARVDDAARREPAGSGRGA